MFYCKKCCEFFCFCPNNHKEGLGGVPRVGQTEFTEVHNSPFYEWTIETGFLRVLHLIKQGLYSPVKICSKLD